ncbi:MAG TPA: hypothetical protein VFT65_01205 [Candidatus Angelobacter sp.]|nr:hypothetical protein [Candidatus Angelobacter sp.]
MKKRGWWILGVVVLVGVWLMVVGYEFLEKENALFQQRVKVAKDEMRRCEARNLKYRTYDQFRTSVRLPYTSDLSLERWMRQYDTLRAGMSEAEVEIIMGAPDFARCSVSKLGDKFEGSEWRYEAAIAQDVANDSQNSGMQIMFGPDGRVKDKNAMNMQPKPSPTPTPVATATPSPSGTPSPVATPMPNVTPQPTPSQNATPAATPSASPAAVPSATATPSPSAKM